MAISKILLATTNSTKGRNARCVNRLYTELKSYRPTGKIDVITSIGASPLRIMQLLQSNHKDISAFHFDGRTENYKNLMYECENAGLGKLSDFLATAPKLNLVFLNYCSTPELVSELRQAGIQVVVATSKRCSYEKLETLTSEFYRNLLDEDLDIEEAFQLARDSAEIPEGERDHYYANVYGNRTLRWWENVPEPRIVGKQKPRIVGEDSSNSDIFNTVDTTHSTVEETPVVPEAPFEVPSDKAKATYQKPPRNWNRPHPFVGNRPFSKDDGDIFFGRDDEVEELSSLVRDKTKPPFIILSGAAGCGKTSLLQAGLCVNLRDEFEVIELSSESVPGMVTVLREELAKKTGKEDLIEAWKTLEGNYDKVYNMTERRILLIVDNIDSILNSHHPRIHRELRQLLAALLPLYANTLFRSQSKIIISVRSFEAMDVNNILSDLELPKALMILKPISRIGLRQAIEAPFIQASPGGHTLATDAADRIESDLLKDPTSVQLPFLQAILENLWTTTHQAFALGTQISLATYEAQHKSCKLFRGFLDEQLQQVQRRLNNEVDNYTLLRLLWYHSSPHHLSTQRSMQDRYLQFPHIDNVTMEKALDAFCDHRLLLALPPSKSGMHQIAHRELSPLVRERLIEMGTPQRSWVHRISANLSRPFTSFGTTKS